MERAWQQEVTAIRKKISRLRGLPRGRPLPLKGVSPGALKQHLAQAFAKTWVDGKWDMRQAVLKALGLLPLEMDLRAIGSRLAQQSGPLVFDEQRRRLLYSTAAPPPAGAQAKAPLVREVCRAMLDRRLTLSRWTRPTPNNSDRDLARQALIQGDCLGVSAEYFLADRGLDLGDFPDGRPALDLDLNPQKLPGEWKAVPPALRQLLLFPRKQGLALIQSIRALHPWSTVTRLYRRPPVSTEQVLHPETLARQERPAKIRPRPLAPLAPALLVHQDVLGEYRLRLLLEQKVGPRRAQLAAEGWDGDMLWAFEDPAGEHGKLVLVHFSTWESDQDAKEWVNALRQVWVAQGRAAQPQPRPQRWVHQTSDQRRWTVERRGEHVFWIGPAPAGQADAVLQQVGRSWRVSGRRIPPAPADSQP